MEGDGGNIVQDRVMGQLGMSSTAQAPSLHTPIAVQCPTRVACMVLLDTPWGRQPNYPKEELTAEAYYHAVKTWIHNLERYIERLSHPYARVHDGLDDRI